MYPLLSLCSRCCNRNRFFIYRQLFVYKMMFMVLVLGFIEYTNLNEKKNVRVECETT